MTDIDAVLALLADIYAGARENHWAEAERLAELVSGLVGPEARDAVDRTVLRAYLRGLTAPRPSRRWEDVKAERQAADPVLASRIVVGSATDGIRAFLPEGVAEIDREGRATLTGPLDPELVAALTRAVERARADQAPSQAVQAHLTARARRAELAATDPKGWAL